MQFFNVAILFYWHYSDVNENILTMFQVAILSVPQLSPTLMKTAWPALTWSNVAAMMTQAPITILVMRLHPKTVTLGMFQSSSNFLC